MTWKCHICGDRRPGRAISVHSKPLDLGPGVVGNQNIRYCNDRADCISAAPKFSLFKEKPND